MPFLKMIKHDFLSGADSEDAEIRWHGYPDEGYSLTTFADSLVAHAYGFGWVMQPPMVDSREALIVDFASATQAEAEKSLQTAWNGPWELPMGAVNTVASRAAINSQNTRIERQLLLIGTGMTIHDFHRQVIEKLLDRHSCEDPSCAICLKRQLRKIADVFKILAYGINNVSLHLYAKWKPSKALRSKLLEYGLEVKSHRLGEIPAPDLEANRYYTSWGGTEAQEQDFLKTVWAPAWKSNV